MNMALKFNKQSKITFNDVQIAQSLKFLFPDISPDHFGLSRVIPNFGEK